MHISEPVANTHTTLEPNAHRTRVHARDVIWFCVFLLSGSLLVLYPFFALCCAGAVVALGCCWLAIVYGRRAGLELWQVILLTALSGYMLLGYGFENLAVHAGGVPIILSYGLVYVAWGLAVFSCQHFVRDALKEPAMLCLSALLLLALPHLVFDIPRYGIWAFRDASMVFDGIFLLLGLLWSTRSNSVIPLMKWLMVFFVLNLIYSYTFPWSEEIKAWSPHSGVFLPVPILGNYTSNISCLLAGALFCIFVGSYVVKWPRWILLLLACLQIFGLAIVQARSMYVGLVLILVILVLLGETRKVAELLFGLSSAVAILLFLTMVLGVEIQGRVGPTNLAFLKQHMLSLAGKEDEPGKAGATLDGRIDWYDQVFRRIRRNPVLGEGFGQPLIDFDNGVGDPARQPHNSSLSVLARLGGVGFALWVIFHLCVVTRCFHAFRRWRDRDRQLTDLIMWLFLFYLIIMVEASTQPALEFPSGSIPFFFFTGLVLGLMRRQTPQRNKLNPQGSAVVPALAISRP